MHEIVMLFSLDGGTKAPPYAILRTYLPLLIVTSHKYHTAALYNITKIIGKNCRSLSLTS